MFSKLLKFSILLLIFMGGGNLNAQNAGRESSGSSKTWGFTKNEKADSDTTSADRKPRLSFSSYKSSGYQSSEDAYSAKLPESESVKLSLTNSQVKTAYIDVYVRGGGQNLMVNLMFNNQNLATISRSNMGDILTILGANGWVLDQAIMGVRPYAFWSAFTRHKTHLIMKKEYVDKDPYGELRDILKREKLLRK